MERRKKNLQPSRDNGRSARDGPRDMCATAGATRLRHRRTWASILLVVILLFGLPGFHSAGVFVAAASW